MKQANNGLGVAVVIVAGGSGTRMGEGLPKQFLPLAGIPILARTLMRLRGILPGASFTVVIPVSHLGLWDEICGRHGLRDTHRVCTGGHNRFESVRNALPGIGPCEWIAVHDGVRPLVTARVVKEALKAAAGHGSAIPAVGLVDTIRQQSRTGTEVVDRSTLFAVQTPQVFAADILLEAYGLPYDEAFTDDAAVVERLGAKVHLCQGARDNIKITTREDLAVAAALLSLQEKTDGRESDI